MRTNYYKKKIKKDNKDNNEMALGPNSTAMQFLFLAKMYK